MRDPLVSIIIPTFNDESDILNCLNSIFDQTYTNWEVIIVNDASNDNTLDIITSHWSADERIRVFTNAQNKGPGYSRKVGINMASGEFIMFVDSDDLLPSKAIADLLTTALGTNSDVTIGQIKRFYFNQYFAKITREYDNKTISNSDIISDLYLAAFFYSDLNLMSLCGRLFKTKVFKNISSDISELRWQEDACLTMEIHQRFKSITFINKNVYLYRHGGVTASFNYDNLKQYLQLFKTKLLATDKYNCSKYKVAVFVELQNHLYSYFSNYIRFVGTGKKRFHQIYYSAINNNELSEALTTGLKYSADLSHPYDQEVFKNIITPFLDNDFDTLYANILLKYDKKKYIFLIMDKLKAVTKLLNFK